MQNLLRLKTIVVGFLFFIVADAICKNTLGWFYGDTYPFLSWISSLLQGYIALGLGGTIGLTIEKRKKYRLIFWLILLLVIISILRSVLPNRLPFWPILHNAFSMFYFSILLSFVLLAVLQIKKLKRPRIVLPSHIAVSLLGMLRPLKRLFHVNLLLLMLLFTAVYYGNNQLETLRQRLETIENKLGGQKKISCNEKDSIEKVRQSVVRIIGGESEGSGFAIKSGGIILTNFHVIEFEPSPKVVLPDNSFDTAEILMADKNADLAIIKINKELPVISWGDPKELNPAEELLAIGFPLGGQLVGEASVNKGSLSGRRRSKDVGVEYLQTDTTLTPGVSGGPMINICGEVVGINTAGLSGLGLAISSDSIKQKWLEMTTSDNSLKDIKKITFDDTESADFAVATFYNYLKVRKLEKAFEILSDNFKKGHGFDYWKQGYAPLLDTTVIKIEEDKDKKDRINIKLSTKDMVDDEIVYKYFEGYWDVNNINGKWRLWEPKIKEVKNPDYLWFYE
ncbi:MAG: trypsin-like peptidase domain-containing protein [bacterium]|nr:trypsin-like peptidase domain-containing protein [bacterium]